MGGYTKEWYWYDDTPLIAAVRNNHFKIAKYLLETGLVNPHFKSCPYDDLYQSALEVAEKSGHQKMIAMLRIAESYFIKSGSQSAHANSNMKDDRDYNVEMTGDLEEMIEKIEKAVEVIPEPTGEAGKSRGYFSYMSPSAVGINVNYTD